MRQTKQVLVGEVDDVSAFQHQTLRTIRVIAEKVPPEEVRPALRAIRALAAEALGQSEQG
jgi:hypothetical protein